MVLKNLSFFCQKAHNFCRWIKKHNIVVHSVTITNQHANTGWLGQLVQVWSYLDLKLIITVFPHGQPNKQTADLYFALKPTFKQSKVWIYPSLFGSHMLKVFQTVIVVIIGYMQLSRIVFSATLMKSMWWPVNMCDATKQNDWFVEKPCLKYIKIQHNWTIAVLDRLFTKKEQCWSVPKRKLNLLPPNTWDRRSNLLSKCKTSEKGGNLLEKEWRELNAGQSVLEWKIFTLKWVWKLNFHSQKSGRLSSKIPFYSF